MLDKKVTSCVVSQLVCGGWVWMGVCVVVGV